MSEIRHRAVETQGIRLQIAEAGEGPLVLLCHGFPETSYSWRHQLPALAAAGYRAVAPDQRGYGGSDRPPEIEDYDIFHLVGDLVGLLEALDERRAVVVGHDWGALVATHCALLRPDLFPALALLGVPYRPIQSNDPPPIAAMRRLAGDRQFYIVYFQQPGRAEAEMEADVRRTLLGLLYSASGDAPPEHRWRQIFAADETLLDSVCVPDELPPWLSEDDLATYVASFEATGFRGGLDWYRNFDRNWELTRFLAGAPIHQPTLFVGGALDPVVEIRREFYERQEETVPGLWKKVLLPGAGHWIQQERPDEVNRLLIEFLGTLDLPS